MNITLLLILLVLASFRITRLLTQDLIPFGPLRDWLFEKRGPKSLLVEWSGCPHCMSVYVSGLLVLVTDRWVLPLTAPVLWWGAVAGATSIIASIVSKLGD